MRKATICLAFLMFLVCTGCVGDLSNDVFYGCTLTVTNYSPRPITDTTVTHDGQVVGSSPQAIQDTQVCIFSLVDNSAQDHMYTYTVSFRDPEGEEHSETFTVDLGECTQVFLAVGEEDGVWSIDYDTAAARTRGK